MNTIQTAADSLLRNCATLTSQQEYDALVAGLDYHSPEQVKEAFEKSLVDTTALPQPAPFCMALSLSAYLRFTARHDLATMDQVPFEKPPAELIELLVDLNLDHFKSVVGNQTLMVSQEAMDAVAKFKHAIDQCNPASFEDNNLANTFDYMIAELERFDVDNIRERMLVLSSFVTAEYYIDVFRPLMGDVVQH